MCYPQHLPRKTLVRDTNLTNHYKETRCGENILEVVKVTGIKHKSTLLVYIIPINQTVNQKWIKRLIERRKV